MVISIHDQRSQTDRSFKLLRRERHECDGQNRETNGYTNRTSREWWRCVSYLLFTDRHLSSSSLPHLARGKRNEPTCSRVDGHRTPPAVRLQSPLATLALHMTIITCVSFRPVTCPVLFYLGDSWSPRPSRTLSLKCARRWPSCIQDLLL